MIEKIYGIDHGYYTIKAIDELNNRYMFRNTFKEGKIINNKIQNCIEVLYNDKYYILGRNNDNYSISNNKNNNEITVIQTLTSIAETQKLSEEVDHNIDAKIVVGLPITQYQKEGKAEEFRNNILKNYKNEIIINGDKFNINIKDIYVFMQGAGIILLYPEFKNDRTLIIDFGGLTIDVSEYEDNINLVNCTSIKNGIIKLYNTISEILKIKYEVDYTNSDIEKMLKTKELTYNGDKIDMTKLINEQIKIYINNIITEIESKSFNISKVDNIILTGGASIFFKDYLKNNIVGFKNCISFNEPVFCNAMAYKDIAISMFQ